MFHFAWQRLALREIPRKSLFGSPSPPPPPPAPLPPAPLPDPNNATVMAAKQQAIQASLSNGRLSTIMTTPNNRGGSGTAPYSNAKLG